MQNQNPIGDIVFMVALILFAAAIVDERWVRVALALVPALLLAQRAWMARTAAAEAAEASPSSERRTDADVRAAIEDLLRLIREFYTTTHLLASGRLGATEARELAAAIERRLNALLAKISDGGRAASGSPGT